MIVVAFLSKCVLMWIWISSKPQIPADVMLLLQKNALLASRIKTFRELSIDFLATESNVFEFGLPDTLLNLHGSLPDPDYPALLGKKLATVCITLNEYPCIRFQSSSPYCREIATTLNYLLLQYKRYIECSLNSYFISFYQLFQKCLLIDFMYELQWIVDILFSRGDYFCDVHF